MSRLSRGAAAVLVTAGLFLVRPAVAWAVAPACTPVEFATTVHCGGEVDVNIPGAPAPGPTGQAPSGPATSPPVVTIEIPEVVPFLPGGGQCVTFLPFQVDVANAAPVLNQANHSTQLLLDAYPPCPATPTQAAPGLDPATLAQQFWQTIPLPVPNPSIPPGYGITGLAAYLVTSGAIAPAPYSEPTPLGPLSVTAVGAYTIDWGDGTTSGPYDFEGEPWPNGQITHTYEDVGTFTVTVTENWTATWSLGAGAGALAALHTTATIPGFAVRQVQAVIVNPSGP
ncbi:MAG: hypothetical protein ACRDYC_11815 [Acidimicrobiales bacterium]